MNLRRLAHVFILSLVAVQPGYLARSQPAAAATVSVPAFTAYSEPDPHGLRIDESSGVTGWTNARERLVWFGNVKNPGSLHAMVRMRAPRAGKAMLRLTVGKQSHTATWQSGLPQTQTLDFGEYRITTEGYCRIALEGVTRTGADFGDPEMLLLSGPAASGIHFNLKERRNAASVHLGYPLEKTADVTAFYNEVTVRTDPLWSYYMACGFQRGYFGIQVNSETERRIIFSVWDSGSESTDRRNVGAEDRVQLTRKGDSVVASDFGNEGTGGHSHRLYSWRKDVTYRFLVTAKPDSSHTTYTAYFFNPDTAQWELIAGFRAPKDGGYLRGLYSFNENFDGANGQLRRLAEFGNQWVLNADGKWHELTAARFTHDLTGREDRKDYGAGTVHDRFYLSNGGFVADQVVYGMTFERKAMRRPPADIPASLLQ